MNQNISEDTGKRTTGKFWIYLIIKLRLNKWGLGWQTKCKCFWFDFVELVQQRKLEWEEPRWASTLTA